MLCLRSISVLRGHNLLLHQSSFVFEWIVLLEMKILSSFIHPPVIPNLHDLLSSSEKKSRFPLTSIFIYIQHKSVSHTGEEVDPPPCFLLYPFE